MTRLRLVDWLALVAKNREFSEWKRSLTPTSLLCALFFFAALLLANGSAAPEASENWPHWRGPNDNGSTSQGSYPVRWDATNVLWKAPLPGKGCSTPVVWDKRLFLTAPVNGQDAALAFDWQGKVLWQRTLGAETPGKSKLSSGCNSSPVTDGVSIFVFFNSATLAALDWEGKVRWQTNTVTAFGPERLYWDRGTSPVLTEKAVIIARMHHGDSWLAAFDKTSGRLDWKVPRNFQTPEEDDNAYTTPLVLREQGGETVVVWGADHLTAHAAVDGRLLWSCGDFNPQSIPHYPAGGSPVIAAGFLIVPCHEAQGTRPELDGIRLGGTGGVSAPHRAWRQQKTTADVPTPAEYNGRVYVLGDRGEVECLDPATGESLWKHALPKASASYFASPVVAGGKLYAAREDGVVFVAQVQDKFEVLAENRMGEQVIASPVAVANRLFIRGERHLFCIAAK
jgi:outer membrane protein assembly factor BamB